MTLLATERDPEYGIVELYNEGLISRFECVVRLEDELGWTHEQAEAYLKEHFDE